MKSSKNMYGFTLIELLTVIAILAVIMIISVPVILDLLEKSKKNTYKNQVLLYVEGLRQQTAYALMGDSYSTLKSIDSDFYTPTDSTESSIVRVSVSNLNKIMDDEVLKDDDSKYLYVEYTSSGYNYYIDEGISVSDEYVTTCDSKVFPCKNISYDGEDILVIDVNDFSISNIAKDNPSSSKSRGPLVSGKNGDAVTLDNYNWHIIGQNDEMIVLLMDSNQLSDHSVMNHCTNDYKDDTDCGTTTYYSSKVQLYSWEKSKIREYLNGDFYKSLSKTTKNSIIPTEICKDPSLFTYSSTEYSYGGYTKYEIEKLKNEYEKNIDCNGGYLSDNVRLISISEYTNLNPEDAYLFRQFPYSTGNGFIPKVDYIDRLTDKKVLQQWLYGNDASGIGSFWSMSSWTDKNSSSFAIDARYISSAGYGSYWDATKEYNVRPVIILKK